MNRTEKIEMLKDLSKGKQSEALQALARQKEDKKLTFALEQCKLPLLQYIAHRLGEPDEKLELCTEFITGVRESKSNPDLIAFVQAFEEKHRQEIENYVQKMDEYYRSRWQMK